MTRKIEAALAGGFLAALAWISTLSWEEPSWHTWREAFQLQLLWDGALKPLQDLELQQQKRSGLNKKLWDQGSSAMSNNLCGAFYWVFSDLSRFWRGSDSDLHKDFCSGPDRIIWPNVADKLSSVSMWVAGTSMAVVTGTCGTDLTVALGSSRWLHF